MTTTTTTTTTKLALWSDEILETSRLWREYAPINSADRAHDARSLLAVAGVDAESVLADPYSLDLGPILSRVLSTVDPSGDGPLSAALWSLFPLAAVVDGLGYLYSSPAFVYSPSRWGISPPRALRTAVERVAAAADVDILAAVVAIADAYCESVDDGDDSSTVAVAGVAVDYREAATYWDLVKLATDHYDHHNGDDGDGGATVDKLEDIASAEHALRVLLACGDLLAAVVALVDHRDGE